MSLQVKKSQLEISLRKQNCTRLDYLGQYKSIHTNFGPRMSKIVKYKSQKSRCTKMCRNSMQWGTTCRWLRISPLENVQIYSSEYTVAELVWKFTVPRCTTDQMTVKRQEKTRYKFHRPPTTNVITKKLVHWSHELDRVRLTWRTNWKNSCKDVQLFINSEAKFYLLYSGWL